jgi:hypothetical protein
MACTACLVCFNSTVNTHSKKDKNKLWKMGAGSGHITNLKQSFLETFDIYDFYPTKVQVTQTRNTGNDWYF